MVAVAVIVCAVVGMLVEKLAYSPVRARGTKMSTLITAIAMSLFLENLAQKLFGASPQAGGHHLQAGRTWAASAATPLLTIAIGVVMMVGLSLFVKYTKRRAGDARRV